MTRTKNGRRLVLSWTRLDLLHFRHQLGRDPCEAEARHLLEAPEGVDAHQARHHRDVDSPVVDVNGKKQKQHQ